MAKKKNRKNKPSESLDALKREFIEGHVIDGKRVFETLRELCKRHGCSYSTLSKVSNKEGWKDRRDKLQEKKDSALDERYVERQVKEADEVDTRTLAVAKRGLTIVEKHFDQAEEVYKTEGKLMAVARLESLSKSAEKFQRMAKLAMGLPTDNGTVSNPDGSPVRFTFNIAGGKEVNEG